MVRRTHTIGVVLGATPKLFLNAIEIKVDPPTADMDNGPAKIPHPKANGICPEVASEMGGHPKTSLSIPFVPKWLVNTSVLMNMRIRTADLRVAGFNPQVNTVRGVPVLNHL